MPASWLCDMLKPYMENWVKRSCTIDTEAHAAAAIRDLVNDRRVKKGSLRQARTNQGVELEWEEQERKVKPVL